MTRVLIVDDSLTDRKLIQNYLEKQTEWEFDTAENGVKALENLQQVEPNVVISDLMMPEMDGMELCARIATQWPHIPVILATGQGSERMAVTALRNGAASYVPKAHLREMLVETIKQVLDIADHDRSYQRLIGNLSHTTYSFTLENDLALIHPLVDLFQHMTYGMGVCDASGRRQIGIALDEALVNAIYHGNFEMPHERHQQVRAVMRTPDTAAEMQRRKSSPPYRDRRVVVRADLTPEIAKFTIRDEGPGFHPSMIPDKGDAKTIDQHAGRGLVLIKNFMDQVTFNEIGNEITMVKHKSYEIE